MNEYKNFKLFLMVLILILGIIGLFAFDSPINSAGFVFTIMGVFAGFYMGFVDGEQRFKQKT